MNNIVLVGAGGTGMSGLAMMFFDIGYKNIICINNIQTDLTDRLARHGLKVIIGHGHYTVDIKDFVIYSDIQAIINGPEITQSRIHQQSPTKKHFHICITYNQFIAEISKRFTTIAIAGSNGKTSTTAMTIWTLTNLLSDQFALGIVGGLMPNFDQQGYAISSDTTIQSDIFHLFEHIFNQKHQLDYSLLKKHLFVIEACEYKDHFLMYDVDYTLVTNIARDHTDYFTTWESYQTAFVRLIHKTRYHSILTPKALAALTGYDLPDISVSEEFSFDNTYLVGLYNASNAGMIEKLLSNLTPTPLPLTGFILSERDSYPLDNTRDSDGHPSLLGMHAGSANEGTRMRSLLSSFQGVGRRMEYLGQYRQSVIYSDYSHHAPAIQGNLQALQEQFPNKTICAIFQPHQAQRVLAGWDDFQQALAGVDNTIIYRLYTAREDFSVLQSQFTRLESISNFDELGTQFAQELGANYITSIDDLIDHMNTISSDIIVYFSAGDLDEEMRHYINQ